MTWEQVTYGFRGKGQQQAASEGGLHGRMKGMPLGLAGAGHVGEKAMQCGALGSGLLDLRNGQRFGLKKWAVKNRLNKIK